MFKILKKDKDTKARLGVLSTPHGTIRTPSYVIVATHAEVKCLRPSDIKKTKTQVVIANTYHLRGKANVHKLLGVKMPIMTDSGGFQVFSLGFGNKFGVGKILRKNTRPVRSRSPLATSSSNGVKITEKGVYFMLDGKKRFLGPELSIKLQEKLGADIIFAFDECTSPLDNYAYNKKALERTHRWAKECLKARKRKDRILFGIIQGGRFKDLRIKSAKFIASLPFEGIGIGGSFGNLPVRPGSSGRAGDEMVETLKWVVPHLPEEKPRHLLGIGRVEDVFNAVEQGIDLFDCVIPTREARHGRIYTKQGHFDIWKYQSTGLALEKRCRCPICKSGVTRTKLHSLFKGDQTTLTNRAKRYATIHNMWFFNNLLEEIRNSIAKGKFKEFKKRFLTKFKV
ncbi:MAG: tRNA guanosine(34) transglycosylase Tgt [Candidatus Yanofskybacteria bacterium]|nr:tRNA guanosine(34) transglycosylase Tgt [Candidatus Yanofskybacteria bacterium]